MRKIVSIILIMLCTLSGFTQDRKKVGLVLSGGGAKGVAHVGALKVIEEAGIPIDYIAGTSMGAIVGALYAIGYTPHQLDSILMTQDWNHLLGNKPKRTRKSFLEKENDTKYIFTLTYKNTPKEIIPDGLINGKNLEVAFMDATTGYHDSIDFNKLPIPYACVTVNLLEGKEVVLRSGSLAQAMRASMAIPAVFTPVKLDSMVLADGGITNNFPVDVAIDMGADVIIGVDVKNDPSENDKMETLIDAIYKMSDMLGKEKYIKNTEDVDVHIKVDVKGFTSASFEPEALDTLISRGEYAARTQWDNLFRLKKEIGINEDFIPDPAESYPFISESSAVYIRSIHFPGTGDTEKAYLLEKSKLKEHNEVKITQLREAVSCLYATQEYTNIKYVLNEVPEGYDLTFFMENNRANLLRLGFRLDWEEVAAILLNAVYNFDTKIPTRGSVTTRFGKRSGVYLEYTVFPSTLRFFNIAYAYEYNDINFYEKGNKSYNTTYEHHLAQINYSNLFSKDMKLEFGIRYEHFRYRDLLFNEDRNTSIPNISDPRNFLSYYALFNYETKNKRIFSAYGTVMQAEVALYTDNFYSYKGHSPFAAINLSWESIYSVTNRLAVIPSAHGRVLFGKDLPLLFLNAAGGDKPGRYLSHQIPFEGINYIEMMDNSLFTLGLRLRQRMGNNHYVYVTGNYGLSHNKVRKILKGENLAGGSIGYGYDSPFGPIRASVNYSNRTDKIGFYLNIGYRF